MKDRAEPVYGDPDQLDPVIAEANRLARRFDVTPEERAAMREAEPDPGPTERQLEDWNIHNDHVDGADYEYGESDVDQIEVFYPTPDQFEPLEGERYNLSIDGPEGEYGE